MWGNQRKLIYLSSNCRLPNWNNWQFINTTSNIRNKYKFYFKNLTIFRRWKVHGGGCPRKTQSYSRCWRCWRASPLNELEWQYYRWPLTRVPQLKRCSEIYWHRSWSSCWQSRGRTCWQRWQLGWAYVKPQCKLTEGTFQGLLKTL